MKPKGNFHLFLAIILYLILFVLFLPYYKYQIDPDAISYIGIAQKYVAGNFNEAINPHWGPLFSWLMVPFLLLPLPTLISVKLLCLVIGIFTVFAVYKLSLRFEISEKIRFILLIPLVLMTLSYSVSVISPDLLILALLTYYLYYLFDLGYIKKAESAVICGVLGGIAALTKGFLLFYFPLHFLLFHLALWPKYGGKVKRNLIIGSVSFLGVLTVWTVILSTKSGHFSLWNLNYGEFAYKFIGSYAPNHRAFFDQGFMAPPNSTATSVWENPLTRLPFMDPWNPFSDFSSFRHQIALVLANTKNLFFIINSFSFFSIPIFILYLIFLWKNWKSENSPDRYKIALTLIPFIPYLLITLVDRYIWIAGVLFLLLTAELLTKFTKSILFSVLVLFTFALYPINSLFSYLNTNTDLYNLSSSLSEREGLKGKNLASDGEWGGMMAIAFFTKSRYFGEAKGSWKQSDLGNELKKFDIDYYFVWKPQNQNQAWPHGTYKEIKHAEIGSLRIYKVKP